MSPSSEKPISVPTAPLAHANSHAPISAPLDTRHSSLVIPSAPAASHASHLTTRVSSAALPHLYLVVVGHVDHGKSTLIGRLLFDTQSVPEGKAERIQAACKAEGMEFEYAFLMDALLEEQAQNITMDTTRVPFSTPRRAFTIIDAPGHKEFLKNMITGAASADAAILLVDAHEGLREQTRRHAYLLSLLGLKQVVVAVNKMDLVNYDQAVYQRIQTELTNYLARLGVTPAHFIPIAAKHGHGLLRVSEHTPWYRGPALLEALEQFRAKPAPHDAPLRFSVQDIYRFDARRIVAGLVEAGKLSVGDPIEFHPGGKRSRVKSIETWPVSAENGAPRGPITAGLSAAITLEDELFVERGQIGAPPGNDVGRALRPTSDASVSGINPDLQNPQSATAAFQLSESREFTARVFWLHQEPLRVGDTLPLRLGTQQAEARLIAVNRVLDAVTLTSSTAAVAEVKRHEVAELRLRVRRPLAFDAGGKIPALGRFVLMRGRRIAGGGVIDAAVGEDAAPDAPRAIKVSSRTAHLGHRGAIIWLTGLSGSGKSTLSAALEQELFRLGVLPVVLDGDVLRTGLCRGLGFSPEDRKENMRRAAEAALLLAETGAVVVTALISPFREDRRIAADRARERGIAFAEVFVNAPLAECERRDPKSLYKQARAGQLPSFTGIDSPYEPPTAPDLELRTDRESIEQSVEKLTHLALTLAHPPLPDAGATGADI
jgi:bifunctional enzyme CysN/CysC